MTTVANVEVEAIKKIGGGIEIISKSAFAFVLILYVTGFFVVSSQLSNYHISDVTIANPNYLAAGGIFCVYLLTFYMCGGRFAVYSQRWVKEYSQRLKQLGLNEVWQALLFIRSLIQLFYMLCFSVTLFSFIALDNKPGPFINVFFGVTAIYMLMLSFGTPQKSPRFDLIVTIIVEALFVAAFFVYPVNDLVFGIFVTYLGFYILINFVAMARQRFTFDGDMTVYFALTGVLTAIGAAILFGSSLYSHVSSKLGGGAPIPATISVSDKVAPAFPAAKQSGGTIKGFILHSENGVMFFEHDNEIIRLPESELNWIRFDNPTATSTGKNQ